MNSSFNKKRSIEHIVKINIHYQGHRERTGINVIEDQKQSVILGMLWLACYNSEIDWRTGEVKMTRCSEECSKQQRPKQGKSEWYKQKGEKKKEKERNKREEKEQKKEKERKKKKKPRKKRIIEVKKIAEKWEICDEKEAKKLVSKMFHKQIYIFGKKASERVPIKKL